MEENPKHSMKTGKNLLFVHSILKIHNSLIFYL